MTEFRLRGRRVWVAGHRGMVGAALTRRLANIDCEVVTVDRESLDLTRQRETEEWLEKTRPHAVFIAAARVGGIVANSKWPAEFIHTNLAIATTTIEACRRVGVEKLLFLGSSCIYPRDCAQPIHEEALLTGPLEPSNQWYAVAKIAGLKLCQAYRRQYGCDFVSVMPTNLYGPGDNFDLESSHVIPALIRKAEEARHREDPTLTIWGSGRPRREFMFVDDLADALICVMQRYSEEAPLNVGTGEDISISALAELVCDVVGYRGALEFDTSRPDGTPRKLLDVRRLSALGWRQKTSLREGLAETYSWYRSRERSSIRGVTSP